MIVGMERMPYRALSSGLASVSIFRIRARPAVRSATLSISGAIMWHGPHHEAQRSIRTGTDALEMAASNTRVFGTSIGAFGRGSAVLHFPHFVGRSSVAYFRRFVVPHEPHAIKMPLSS